MAVYLDACLEEDPGTYRRFPLSSGRSRLMYLRDTNVVSELRKAKAGKADARLTAWAAGVPASERFLSAISVLELEMGVLLVERRDSAQGAVLRSWLNKQVLRPDAHNLVAIAGQGSCPVFRPQ
ncbi:hypothetical protein [Zoogloea sp.]|uniref:hypothetical protein n=1 Tax=Zoogloea sp. TaxID=49181 RepID=UPI00262F3E69|nr:hypothetical protein [Zoogloea sp.]MDD3354343.1 hypothetical protein [Zoogloea sp.]